MPSTCHPIPPLHHCSLHLLHSCLAPHHSLPTAALLFLRLAIGVRRLLHCSCQERPPAEHSPSEHAPHSAVGLRARSSRGLRFHQRHLCSTTARAHPRQSTPHTLSRVVATILTWRGLAWLRRRGSVLLEAGKARAQRRHTKRGARLHLIQGEGEMSGGGQGLKLRVEGGARSLAIPQVLSS